VLDTFSTRPCTPLEFHIILPKIHPIQKSKLCVAHHENLNIEIFYPNSITKCPAQIPASFPDQDIVFICGEKTLHNTDILINIYPVIKRPLLFQHPDIKLLFRRPL